MAVRAAGTSTYPWFGYSVAGEFDFSQVTPTCSVIPPPSTGQGERIWRKTYGLEQEQGPVTIVGTANSGWGDYFIANEIEQGNEELVCLNRSLTVPLPYISLLPRLSPAPDFTTSSSPLLTLVFTWLSVSDFYSFLLAAAVQQFFSFLKYSSLSAAVADGSVLAQKMKIPSSLPHPLVC